LISKIQSHQNPAPPDWLEFSLNSMSQFSSAKDQADESQWQIQDQPCAYDLANSAILYGQFAMKWMLSTNFDSGHICFEPSANLEAEPPKKSQQSYLAPLALVEGEV